MPQPYTDSRRLTGPNLYLRGCGAALETAPGTPTDPATLQRWQANVAALRARLGWPADEVVARVHASGASLALAAPCDQLYSAAAANEWAWCDALGLPLASDEPALDGIADRAAALDALQAMAAAEANPRWAALVEAAAAHALPLLADDEQLTLGMGEHARTWPMTALPPPDDVEWASLRAIPTALVTGSNGKTTTVRLLAAMLRAHGLHVAHSCTDGVFFDGVLLEAGDYSGPGGARSALRHPQAQAAVLETARGGMLRRGLAIERADVAIVTNVSADHFGEYGIHDLAALAQAKLVVARAIDAQGLLLLNADDALLRRFADDFSGSIGWFALDADVEFLRAHAAAGGALACVRDDHLLATHAGVEHDLGAVAAMPLATGGHARYNIANCAAAALAALQLGVPAKTVATVLARFGAAHADNPGRLQQWRLGDATVLLDYAHNAAGLEGLLGVARPIRGNGRLGLLLGHAGNRTDEDIRALAPVAHAHRPDRVWLKDIGGEYLRGRAPGDIARILQRELQGLGMPPDALVVCLDEAVAVREALRWTRPGDLLVLPVHEPGARAQVVAMLDALQSAGWQAGAALPD